MEVLIATGILITAAAALPQLFTAATRANVEAGAITWATTLAAQKLDGVVIVDVSELTLVDAVAA